MYQKGTSEGLQKFGVGEQSWQDNAAFADIMSIEPTALTFTPSTLATMENTLMALESEIMSGSESNTDDDDSNLDWEPSAKRSNSTVSSTTSSKRLPGPKSRVRTEDMTPEEIQRRQRRRERNKQAAARCRQRRIDQTNVLLAETQVLEAEAQKLEQEIENLRKQRDQLQFVLDAHRPTCRGEVSQVTVGGIEPIPQISQQIVASTHSAVRPNSLAISQRTAPSVASTASEVLGDAFAFNFDLGLGSTGFTPVVSSAGMGVFLGSGADFVSPTALMLSPSTLLAQ